MQRERNKSSFFFFFSLFKKKRYFLEVAGCVYIYIFFSVYKIGPRLFLVEPDRGLDGSTFYFYFFFVSFEKKAAIFLNYYLQNINIYINMHPWVVLFVGCQKLIRSAMFDFYGSSKRGEALQNGEEDQLS